MPHISTSYTNAATGSGGGGRRRRTAVSLSTKSEGVSSLTACCVASVNVRNLQRDLDDQRGRLHEAGRLTGLNESPLQQNEELASSAAIKELEGNGEIKQIYSELNTWLTDKKNMAVENARLVQSNAGLHREPRAAKEAVKELERQSGVSTCEAKTASEDSDRIISQISCQSETRVPDSSGLTLSVEKMLQQGKDATVSELEKAREEIGEKIGRLSSDLDVMRNEKIEISVKINSLERYLETSGIASWEVGCVDTPTNKRKRKTVASGKVEVPVRDSNSRTRRSRLNVGTDSSTSEVRSAEDTVMSIQAKNLQRDLNDQRSRLHEALTEKHQAQEQFRKGRNDWEQERRVMAKMGSELKEELEKARDEITSLTTQAGALEKQLLEFRREKKRRVPMAEVENDDRVNTTLKREDSTSRKCRLSWGDDSRTGAKFTDDSVTSILAKNLQRDLNDQWCRLYEALSVRYSAQAELKRSRTGQRELGEELKKSWSEVSSLLARVEEMEKQSQECVKETKRKRDEAKSASYDRDAIAPALPRAQEEAQEKESKAEAILLEQENISWEPRTAKRNKDVPSLVCTARKQGEEGVLVELCSAQEESGQTSSDLRVAETERRVISDDLELMVDQEQRMAPESDECERVKGNLKAELGFMLLKPDNPEFTLIAELEEFKEKIGSMNTERAELVSKIDVTSRELETLSSQLDLAKREKDMVVSIAEEAGTQLVSELMDAKKKAETLSSALYVEREKTRKELEAASILTENERRKILLKVVSYKDAIQRKIKTLSSQLDLAEREKEMAVAIADEAGKHKIQHVSELETTKKRMENLSSELDIEREKARMETEAASLLLEKEKRILSSVVNEAKSERAELVSKMDATRREMKALSSQLDLAKMEKEKAKSSVDDLRKEKCQVVSDFEASKEIMRTLSSKLDFFKKECYKAVSVANVLRQERGYVLLSFKDTIKNV